MGGSCPVCEKKEFKQLGKSTYNNISREFINREYSVVMCENCFTYFVSPQIEFSDEQWSKLYHSEYFSGQSAWLIKKRSKELQKRFSTAEKFMKAKNGRKSLLDIGTGEGKVLIYGITNGWNVTGIDIVDNRMDDAMIKGINFIKGKFLEIDLPENSFDFIFADLVIEHVQQPLQYLQKMRQLLKPGGIIYIGVPNEDSLLNQIRRLGYNLTGKKQISDKLKPFEAPYHVIGFNHKSLNFIFKKAGLKPRLFRNFERKFNFMGFPIRSRQFWISLFILVPTEIMGFLMKREYYFEAYLSKE